LSFPEMYDNHYNEFYRRIVWEELKNSIQK
jgi:hypothetical protein